MKSPCCARRNSPTSWAAMLPLLGVDMAIGGSLRGAGDTRFPLITSFLGLIGVRCALAATFALLHVPVVWVYSSIIGDYMLKGSMLVLRFKSGRWKHVRDTPGSCLRKNHAKQRSPFGRASERPAHAAAISGHRRLMCPIPAKARCSLRTLICRSILPCGRGLRGRRCSMKR